MKKLLLILLCLPLIGFGQQTFNFMHNGLNREYILGRKSTEKKILFCSTSMMIGRLRKE